MPADSRQSQMSVSALLGGLLGVVFLIYNFWSFADHYRLLKSGATRQAQVTAAKVERRKGGISYVVEYAFDQEGKPYVGSGGLSQQTFGALHLGGPIAIRYASNNPSISEPAEMSHDRASLFLHGLIGIPIGLLMIFAAFRKEQTATGHDQILRGAPIEIPPRVRGIAFTVYPVADMKRARQFYEEDLGLKISENFRGEWIEYHLRDNCFAITTMLGDAARPSADSGGRIALEVCSLDKFVAELKHKGIRVLVEPFSTPVCRMAVLVDPEGNALTLHERLA